MERILIALVVGLCLFAVGCPKRLVDRQHRTNPVHIGQSGETHSSQTGEDLVAEGDALTGEEGQAGESGASELAEDSPATRNDPDAEARDGAEPDEPGDSAADENVAQNNGADAGSGGFVGPVTGAPGDGPTQTPGAESGAEDNGAGEADENNGDTDHGTDQSPADNPGESGADDSSNGQNLLDPGSTEEGDVVNGPPGYGSQQAAGTAGFAGTWQVICATADGASVTFRPGDWVLELAADGSMTITRKDGGKQRQQTGSWQADDFAIAFNLGPGGQPSYTVFGDDQDVKVFADEDGQTALFAVRLAPGAAVPQLFQRYDSDFGALRFSQSGPGVWNGTYGDSGGKLAVRLTGPFCTGAWEQGSAHGGVVLRLTASGFTGWWWYDGSLKIDGTWNGTTGK